MLDPIYRKLLNEYVYPGCIDRSDVEYGNLEFVGNTCQNHTAGTSYLGGESLVLVVSPRTGVTNTIVIADSDVKDIKSHNCAGLTDVSVSNFNLNPLVFDEEIIKEIG